MSPELSKTPEYRVYTLGEVLFFATGGRLVSPIHQQDVMSLLDLCSYMTGQSDVHMLEASGVAHRCREAVLEQHPGLEQIAAKFEEGEGSELDLLFKSCNGDYDLWHQKITAWLDSQQETPGEPLTLVPVPDYEKDPRSIAELAVETAGPNLHKLVLATTDSEGNIVFPE